MSPPPSGPSAARSARAAAFGESAAAVGAWAELVAVNRRAAHVSFSAEAAATGSGRILTLTITPWLMGQPHRVRALGALLDRILEHAEVWPATGAEIVDAWRAHAS